MRSLDNESGIKRGGIFTIPDFKGAASGLNGIKAPFGTEQQGEINERLLNNGHLEQRGTELVLKK